MILIKEENSFQLMLFYYYHYLPCSKYIEF